MGKPVVYIDGQAGTTGLQIYDRLSSRTDIELVQIDEARRKDTEDRKRLMNAADVVFLCLPDAAAVEAVTLVENPNTRIIDASTAHRTDPAWDYGFPELSARHRERIQNSKRVANPGCHATGFIAAVYPLVATGLLARDTPLSVFSLTGYSGGGKKMIAQYESAERSPLPQPFLQMTTPAGAENRGESVDLLKSPSIYAMGQAHKHLPEMQAVCGLACPPVFCPIVADYYKGMATTVPLHSCQLTAGTTLAKVQETLQEYYAGQPLIHVAEPGTASLYANARAGADDLLLVAAGNDERLTVTSVFDNLGKGASGAAVENMNLMLGLDPLTGLTRQDM